MDSTSTRLVSARLFHLREPFPCVLLVEVSLQQEEARPRDASLDLLSDDFLGGFRQVRVVSIVMRSVVGSDYLGNGTWC